MNKTKEEIENTLVSYKIEKINLLEATRYLLYLIKSDTKTYEVIEEYRKSISSIKGSVVVAEKTIAKLTNPYTK